MSVIVVGDRAVGKTTMVYYLADSSDQEQVIIKVLNISTQQSR